jgi:hypothetical protein
LIAAGHPDCKPDLPAAQVSGWPARREQGSLATMDLAEQPGARRFRDLQGTAPLRGRVSKQLLW